MTRQLQSISNLTITLLINCCGLASITIGWPIKSSPAVSVCAALLLKYYKNKTTKKREKNEQTSMSLVVEGLPVVLFTLESGLL